MPVIMKSRIIDAKPPTHLTFCTDNDCHWIADFLNILLKGKTADIGRSRVFDDCAVRLASVSKNRGVIAKNKKVYNLHNQNQVFISVQ